MTDLLLLSKTISHALRHEPWLYEIEPDSEGWVPVAQLLDALRGEFGEVTFEDVQAVIDTAAKLRHEISDGRIRARYGHSLPGRIRHPAAVPPALLWHGTSRVAWQRIQRNGLRPMARQFVHLSADCETAELVGRRKDPLPTILQVEAEVASREGIAFYAVDERTWLTESLPVRYLAEVGSLAL